MDIPISRLRPDGGLSNGSFFYRFKTRRALVEAVVSEVLTERQAARMMPFTAPGTIREAALIGVISVYLRWCETGPGHARLLLILLAGIPDPGHAAADGAASPREEIGILEA